MSEIRQLLFNLSEFCFNNEQEGKTIRNIRAYANKTETTLHKQVKEFNGGVNPECS